MHDINELERRGLPGMFVASSEFVEAAAAQGKALGFAPAAHFVPHPIQGENDAAIQALASAAAEPIMAHLLCDDGTV